MSGVLNGKVAVITGGASGIGRATCKRFAAEGATVVTFDRAPEVEETARAIRHAGGKAISIIGDAGSEPDIADTIERTVSEFGRLDVFYANAGISGQAAGGIFDATPDIWAETLRINLIGPFLAIKHATPAIEACGGGAIICTASAAGLRSGAGPAHYSASKAGVINLVQTAAQQVAGKNIRINAICPGLIETGMTQFAYDAARAAGKADRIGSLNPLLRGGEPEEIAAVALFLAGPDSSYVNGQAIVADGGLSSSHPTARRPGDPKRKSSW